MRNSTKKISVVLVSLGLILSSQSAFAARMGKSSNSGMQRSVTTANSTGGSSYNSGATNSAAGNAAAQGQQRKGPGMGAVVAGAAAGAVGGYMLGKAANNNASQPQSTGSSDSQIPWGIIAILGLLLGVGLIMFKRKASPAAVNNQGQFNNGANSVPPQNNNFDIPNIRKDNANYVPGQYTSTQSGNGATANQAPTITSIEKLPDGIETQYFLRQVKGTFLHIQSMNTPDNVSEVEKYMTPALYADIKASIVENDYVADFSQLDCRLLDAATENATYIASVLFFGKVSESPTSPVVDYQEIWHFIKPATEPNAKWVVAGIQQVTSA